MNPLKLLIVDDDRDFAEGLTEMLELQGHTVQQVHDGASAVRKLQSESFDLALVDVRMPGMNGVESYFAMKKVNPAVPVMMMTAYSTEELLQSAIDGGALGVLNKPFEPADVFRALESVKPAGVVLVVDDDHDFAAAVEAMLAAKNYRVVVAATAEEALARAGEGWIDVLVLDLCLPVLSGIEVYLELDRRGHRLPTVVVTGYARQEAHQIKALEDFHVTGVLNKPFPPDALLQAIEETLSRQSPES